MLSSTDSSNVAFIWYINEEEHLTNCTYVKHSKIHNDRVVIISSSFTAFKQFCVLYFTIAIEIKDIMETIAIEIKDMETIAIEIKDIMEADNYHTANTKRGSASNKNHQFCVG